MIVEAEEPGTADLARTGQPASGLSGQVDVTSRAWAIPSTWTINGLNEGRPLASKSFLATAELSSRDCTQAVDRFGGEGNESARGQHGARVGQGRRGGLIGIDLDHTGFHRAIVAFQSSFLRAERSGGSSPRA